MATAWGVPRRSSPDMDAINRMVASLPAEGATAPPMAQAAPVPGPRVTDTQTQGYVPLAASSSPVAQSGAASPVPIGDGMDLGRIDAMPQLPPMAAAVQQQRRGLFQKDGPFRKGGKGWHTLGIIGDMLSAVGGGQPTYLNNMLLRQKEEREDARELRKQNQPQFSSVPGVGLVAINPADMTSKVVAAAKSPAQVYAETQGHQPGTPDYNNALTDYVLKSSGPTGFGYRAELQDDRQEAARQALEENIELRRQLARWSNQTSRDNNIRSTGTSAANNVRSTSTSAANNVRSTSTSAANNQRSTSQSNVNSVRSAETTRGGASYQGRGGRGGRAAGSSARIINPANGRAAVLQNGKWVDEQTGRPIQ